MQPALSLWNRWMKWLNIVSRLLCACCLLRLVLRRYVQWHVVAWLCAIRDDDTQTSRTFLTRFLLFFRYSLQLKADTGLEVSIPWNFGWRVMKCARVEFIWTSLPGQTMQEWQHSCANTDKQIKQSKRNSLYGKINDVCVFSRVCHHRLRLIWCINIAVICTVVFYGICHTTLWKMYVWRGVRESDEFGISLIKHIHGY